MSAILDSRFRGGDKAQYQSRPGGSLKLGLPHGGGTSLGMVANARPRLNTYEPDPAILLAKGT